MYGTNESDYGDFSSEHLRVTYSARARALQRDRWADMPGWVRDDPASALREKRFIVCGSHMPGEIRHAMDRLDVVAIVDDFRREEELFGVPRVSSDQWIERARKDPSLVSLVYAETVPGYNHFMRCCSQHRLPFLQALDCFRLLSQETAGFQGVGNTFVYGLPFFQHAVEHAGALLDQAAVFDDDFSRFTYFCLLNYRLTADPNFLFRCGLGKNRERIGFNTYAFNRSFFDYSDDEVLVDGGGFDGDSIEDFVRAVHGRFRRIYCFEPLPQLADLCEQRGRALSATYPGDIAKKISVIRKGLWNREARLDFNPTMYAADQARSVPPAPQSAHVIETGLVRHIYSPEVEQQSCLSIDTASIDEACPEPVSLIKLEIEGSELEALQGAARTIARHRPKMAISIYHKPEDLLTLTAFVQQTGLGYKMSLRQHHTYVPDALVCYCR